MIETMIWQHASLISYTFLVFKIETRGYFVTSKIILPNAQCTYLPKKINHFLNNGIHRYNNGK